MDAKVIRFPVAKKPAAPAKSRENRINQAVKHLEEKFGDSINRMFEEQRRKEEAAFQRWLDGVRVPASEFVGSSDYGLATDTFGEGPKMFRWAVASTRKADVLKPSEKDEALRLAIEQLNQIGLTVRLGGGLSGGSDFEKFATADLGRTLRRLAMFGCVSSPTAEEREILAARKAEYEAGSV